ncbi:MAG: hypothetical protein QM638_15375 [Nocardioides sp.]|uniref:hypothetical protein n=1 Tax=Nocardioides sp. TaxID=35761 RepID=UPI0039E37A47
MDLRVEERLERRGERGPDRVALVDVDLLEEGLVAHPASHVVAACVEAGDVIEYLQRLVQCVGDGGVLVVVLFEAAADLVQLGDDP